MSRFLKVIFSALLLMLFAFGCDKVEDPNNGNDNNEEILDGHEYVDLGLPSGTLWASCNVGADTPEGIGDYFAWGETATKELYDWKSYVYGNYSDMRFEMTKYCMVPSWGLDGFVDSLTVLEPNDDAARANWGERWRMATKEEWEELFQKTTCVWTTQNGVEGRLMAGTNGNSIFLPVTGFRLDDMFIGPSLGIYWSSSLHEGFPERGWSFHFDADQCHVCGTYERSRGQIVRAVYIAKQQ